jgi:hypothetical protein
MAGLYEKVIKPVLYLEGVRFPFQSVQIQESINQPATITISIPPNEEVLDIKKRTTIHLFNRTADGLLNLLFEGEITNTSYSRGQHGRNMTLEGMGIWNLLFTTKAYYFPDYGFGSEMGTYQLFADSAANQDQGVPRITKARAKLVIEAFQLLLGNPGGQRTQPDLQQFLIKLIDQTTAFNEFNLMHSGRYRIRDRIMAMPDDEARDLYLNERGLPIIMGTFKGAQPSSSLMNILAETLGVFYYDVIFPAAPPIVEQASLTGDSTGSGKTINDIIMKPHTAYTAPPSCNILFPSDISQFTHVQGGLFAEPTRARATINPASFGGGQGLAEGQAYLSPATMRAVATYMGEAHGGSARSFSDTVRVDPSKSQDRQEFGIIQNNDLVSAILGTDVELPDIFNEDLHGIVSLDFKLGMNLFQNALGQLADPSELPAIHRAMLNLVEYEHINAIHTARTISVHTVFKPQIAVGFPMVMLDRERSFFGEVQSVTHVINAEGQAQSMVSMRYVHDRDVFSITRDDEKVTLGLVNPPGWYNRLYLPENVGITTYPQLLGTKSIMEMTAEFDLAVEERILEEAESRVPEYIDGEPVFRKHIIRDPETERLVPTTLVGAAMLLLEATLGAKDPARLSEEVTSRPVPEFRDLFDTDGWYGSSASVIEAINRGEIPDVIDGGRLFGADLPTSAGHGKSYDDLADLSGIIPFSTSRIAERVQFASNARKNVIIRAVNLFRQRGFSIRG